MSEPRVSISSRRSQDSRSGQSISHGRGGAGNIGKDDTEYVDGGFYAVETPGSDGKGFSSGRGGAGNVAPPAKDDKEYTSDRQDFIAEESVVNAPGEGEGYSTGRGGAANVHPQGAKTEEKHQEEKHEVNGSGKVARLGLADKLKYKLFRKTPPI